MSLFVETGRVVAIALVLVLGCDAAHADAGNWRLGNGDEGLVTASVRATNKLITGGGALSYSPTLTIACRPDGEPRWTEWLQLNDSVSASRKITMSVTVDAGAKFDESWSVGPRGRTLVRDGVDGVRRLVPANRLLLSWRFGLLSGRGEADFDLAGLGEAVAQIAGTCNTDAP
ncbi:MAG: hypothetical protein E5V49_09580 [Mesorhizobium sp.]|nr:hypothetical protein EN848_13085 [bacterium M00.F.Ca.ET.205.01.1.1]TGU47499.1 hypothetical protein EN795_29680 [bacterium M00.F.Ca.ET.152.01.1.1]TGV32200.1 hypothetical protein EN829_029220 [Mesorhizobium sp. M00.F.Ca.ET.186.01.1.1]TGZ39275.1 hypothetical protein EN805_29790 [bacterium M00.F.Ca.ET.162.01.1.1]TIW60798.1 MAG: hypothetical protein E5V48_11945 [Mesorhizobium sp.]